MKDRVLYKLGSYGVALLGIAMLLFGTYQFVLGSDATALGVINLGVGFISTALLLRVVRWEVNE